MKFWRRVERTGSARSASIAPRQRVGPPGERLNADGTLACIAARIAVNRSRARARGALSAQLAGLDSRRWQVEPDVQLAGVTIPFVAFGPSAVFALTASPAWAVGDLTVMQEAAEDL